ncbi:hypothetical protein IFT73_17745 [Aeromicrobium sp. CFBP 8757]|uniref:hypothetical protein n=1 Tax=Aeromicrobium sp. CFBP 8757 TaxID=2775288 RepID=UPI001780F125|nr:hypothetical protein [Aeromicrobium sp. CFBP 8757]MBD8608702.1 hypothetical protein [Aeromicrobium sp. CFBP 8757]
MTRITLVFTLSDPRAQVDLLHEFTLHDGVVATAADIDGSPAIRVETHDSVSTVWDVRATVGMFDDRAREQQDQG